jgi:hypothetical protein
MVEYALTLSEPIVKPSEKTARQIYQSLPARDQQLVLTWLELGNDWCTSVLNSGVMRASGSRTTQQEAARDAERQRSEQLISDQYRRATWRSTDFGRRREAAEHEAAHGIVAQALGLDVRLAHISGKGGGQCLYECGTPHQTAVVAMAGDIWINVFRSYEFVGGAHGCEDDRQTYLRAVPDDVAYNKAYRECFDILRRNYSTIIALADRIDKDGHYIP